jgi:uncharacterized protein (DUF1800 family)
MTFDDRTATPPVIDEMNSDPETTGHSLSRRDLFRLVRRPLALATGAAAGAFWGAPRSRALASDVSADVDPGALLRKLASRITMGPTSNELGLAYQLGYSGYLEYHLNHTAIDDTVLNGRIATLTTLTQNYSTLVTLPASQVIGELSDAVILRALLSNRQLFERMVEFWTDHFNILIDNGNGRYMKTTDDRDVIRQHALATFPQLLNASAKSPAMLFFLDNYTSVVGNPNENYARELMELHTMGVDGGYTQHDVEEVARCFTGWGISTSAGASNGTFLYNNTAHDQGQKTVLGNIIPAGGGMQDGLTVLSILTGHPSTARFLAAKLCRWLLGEGTPQSVVTAVADAYTSSGGNIKSMIRAALLPGHLHDAPPRYKRPFHYFTSVMRAINANVTSTANLRNNLNSAGHRPYYWITPDGYPDSLSHWVGLVLPRWNFAASVAAGQFSGVTYDLATFFAGATTADQMAERINTALFAGEMDPADKLRIRDYLAPQPTSTTKQRDALGLALSSPAFHWY